MPSSDSRSWKEWLLFLLVVGLTCTALCINSTRWFDFFDMSGFLDAAYRVFRGQHIYRDFFFHVGPVHPYFQASLFHLFGFTEQALWAEISIETALVMYFSYLIARKYLAMWPSLGLTWLTGISFYGPISHPWYDQNAYVWVLGAFAILEGWGSPKWVAKKFQPVACGILVALSFLTKANVGAVAGVFLFLHFLRYQSLVSAISFLASAGLTTLALLGASQSLKPFIVQSFLSFQPSGRLLNWRKLLNVVTKTAVPYFLLLGALVARLGGRSFVKKQEELFFRLLSLSAIMIFSAWTGSILYTAQTFYCGPVLIYVAILLNFYLATPRTAAPTQPWLTGLTGAVGVLFLIHAVQLTVTLEAWAWRNSPEQIPGKTSTHFQATDFHLWKCDPTVCPGVNQVVAFLNGSVPPQDSILVLPDATIIYGLTNRESYPKCPMFFQNPHPGLAVPFGEKIQQEFREYFTSHPPVWIVLHEKTDLPFADTDRVLEFFGIEDQIKNNYSVVWQKSNFEIRHIMPIKEHHS